MLTRSSPGTMLAALLAVAGLWTWALRRSAIADAAAPRNPDQQCAVPAPKPEPERGGERRTSAEVIFRGLPSVRIDPTRVW